MDPKMSVGFR